MRSLKDKISESFSKVSKQKAPSGEDHPVSAHYTDGQYIIVEIDRIAHNPQQPRKYFDQVSIEGLADSIREKGLMQPVVVSVNENREICLIAGERRLRACKLAGLAVIPAIVKLGDSGELAIIENLQRMDLNPIDEAEALWKLKEAHGYSHEKLAAIAGKARSTITEMLGLTRLPESVKEECRQSDRFPARLLIEISKLGSEQEMLELFEMVKNAGLKSEDVRRETRGKTEGGAGGGSGTSSVKGPVSLIKKFRTFHDYVGRIEPETYDPEGRDELIKELKELSRVIKDTLKRFSSH